MLTAITTIDEDTKQGKEREKNIIITHHKNNNKTKEMNEFNKNYFIKYEFYPLLKQTNKKKQNLHKY